MKMFGHISNKINTRDTSNTSRRPRIGLRMAPMIDMIFLLLIFFLVAANYRPKEDYLPLQLATAAAGTQTLVKPEPLTFQILATDTGCRVQIGTSGTVDIASLNPEQGLAALIEKTSQCLFEQKRYVSDPIEITCEAGVKWDFVARIYNALYGMGLTDITFQMTEPPNDEGPG